MLENEEKTITPLLLWLMFSRAAMIFVRILFAILPVEANEAKKKQTNKQTHTSGR